MTVAVKSFYFPHHKKKLGLKSECGRIESLWEINGLMVKCTGT